MAAITSENRTTGLVWGAAGANVQGCVGRKSGTAASREDKLGERYDP
jgi:hypothetical protein